MPHSHDTTTTTLSDDWLKVCDAKDSVLISIEAGTARLAFQVIDETPTDPGHTFVSWLVPILHRDQYTGNLPRARHIYARDDGAGNAQIVVSRGAI